MYSIYLQIIDEEKELNEVDSPFKDDLNTIYYECCEQSIQINSTPSSTDKISKGSRIWLSFTLKKKSVIGLDNQTSKL
ncbi:unnamed protein product [Adineta ricciae]|uniref:Uncharacterized protein n=1 Tax=Adineta ricciae TaxID=249248 RepID=A0A815KPZ8_ADIRI|nr:unnamed protein product [Adineta ricciae]